MPKKSSDKVDKSTPVVNITNLPVVTIDPELDWYHEYPVLRNLVIDIARAPFRACRLRDSAGLYAADANWAKWLLRWKRRRTKWVSISSKLRLDYRINLPPPLLKKNAVSQPHITPSLY
jgi:hypothetical protein